MDVTIETSTGRTFSIRIPFFAKIHEVKEQIQRFQGFRVSSQILVMNGQILDDFGDTAIYNILPGSRIRLQVPSASTNAGGTGRRNMRVIVQSQCGTKKIPVVVDPSDNVGVLREALARLHGPLQFPLPSEYFFIHKQSAMDDHSTFRELGVRAGDTIEVFPGYMTD